MNQHNQDLQPPNDIYCFDDRRWYETRPQYVKRCERLLNLMRRTDSLPGVIEIYTTKLADAKTQPYSTRILDITFSATIATALITALFNGLPSPIFIIAMATNTTYVLSRKWTR